MKGRGVLFVAKRYLFCTFNVIFLLERMFMLVYGYARYLFNFSKKARVVAANRIQKRVSRMVALHQTAIGVQLVMLLSGQISTRIIRRLAYFLCGAFVAFVFKCHLHRELKTWKFCLLHRIVPAIFLRGSGKRVCDSKVI